MPSANCNSVMERSTGLIFFTVHPKICLFTNHSMYHGFHVLKNPATKYSPGKFILNAICGDCSVDKHQNDNIVNLLLSSFVFADNARCQLT